MGRREEAFERTAMVHARDLLRFARRLTRDAAEAEDLVQESLLRAWRGFGRFEPGTNARAWLFRILMNVLYAGHRKARPSPTHLAAAGDLPAAGGSGAEHVEVTEALDRLGAEQRAVLLLAVLEGFTCREIAEILGVPIGTVMSRLSRAREAMRDALSTPARRTGERVTR
jgi:RNA polymerase sigma-70 factor, ECF subfamily